MDSDTRIYSDRVRVIYKGRIVEILAQRRGPTGPFIRCKSLDPGLFLNHQRSDGLSPLGVEFTTLMDQYNANDGYAGLSFQDFIDKLGLHDR